MSLEGSIKDFGLSDIFQLIHVQQKSGLMTVRHQSRKATVGFLKGMVVSAQSDDRDGAERIGDVLVRAKRITPKQLETALKIQRDRGEFLGQVLVSEGFLNPEDLRRALRLQTLEAVYRLFRWKEGRYAFDQQPVSYPKDFLEPISTEHILMEGVRRLDEWPYIEKKIPSLDAVFAQTPGKEGEIDQAAAPKPPSAANDDPLADLDFESEGRFSPDEVTVYHAVNGTHRVSHLIELVQLGEFEVCKALANLLTAGLIIPISVPEIRDDAHGVSSLEQPGRLRVWLSAGAQWAANFILVAALSAGALWSGSRAWDRLGPHLEADIRSTRLLLYPHHVRSLQELVRVWRADRGRVPVSVFEPIAAYGVGTWPLSDPWGNPWTYDPATDRVSSQ